MSIKTGDLRKDNWIKTEFGVVQVAYVIWNDVYVKGKDGRVLYAREVEGIGIGEIYSIKGCQSFIKDVLKNWLFIHEMQNFYYWNNGKELKLEL